MSRRALVLASTGGLGEASARALAAQGMHVAVAGRRHDRAAAIAAELEGAIAAPMDLLDAESRSTALDHVLDAWGGVDVVVLNGPGPAPSTPSQLDGAAALDAVGRLVAAHLDVLARVLPGMRERRWGRVLAIGSSGVVAPIPSLAASNLGRSALAAHLKGLATEVAADGVTVNLLLPGRIATDRVAELDAAAASRSGRSVDEVRTASESTIPVGRYGAPGEFGAVAAFLCSESASYVTGTAVRCDGGLIPTL